MKKLGVIVGIVLLAAGLFAIGWALGLRQRVLTEAYAIATVDKALTDASVKAMLIEQMDSGRPGDAREHLELQLAGDILTVDALIDSSDARTRELAQKVFARIAAYRAARPKTPAANALSEPEIDAKIASILERAKNASPKQ